MDNTTENAAGEASKAEDLMGQISKAGRETQEKLVQALLNLDAMYKDLLRDQNQLVDRNEVLEQEVHQLKSSLRDAGEELSQLESANTKLLSEVTEIETSRDEWKGAFHRIRDRLGEMLQEKTESFDAISVAANRISFKEAAPLENIADWQGDQLKECLT